MSSARPKVERGQIWAHAADELNLYLVVGFTATDTVTGGLEARLLELNSGGTYDHPAAWIGSAHTWRLLWP